MTTRDVNRSYSVQVKTLTSGGSWFPLGQKARTIKSDTHIYVLIDLKKKKDVESVVFYVVPSRTLAKICEPANGKITNFVVNINNLTKYKEGWSVFGDPSA